MEGQSKELTKNDESPQNDLNRDQQQQHQQFMNDPNNQMGSPPASGMAPPIMDMIHPIDEEALMFKNEPLNDSQQNPTIYVQNLNEKLFSNIGVDVLEVHAKKNIRMRGQAFIVCGDEDQASQAIRQLRGQAFFGKPLRLNYSSKMSDVVAKVRGTFKEEVKGKRKEAQKQNILNKEIKKKNKMIMRLYMLKDLVRKGENAKNQKEQFKGGMGQPGQKPGMSSGFGGQDDYQDPYAPPGSMPSFREQMPMGNPAVSGPPRGFQQEQINNILFLSDLPRDIQNQKLMAVFGSYSGFREIRQVKERGVAFVEFNEPSQAQSAKAELSGAIADELGDKVRCTYANK